MQGFAGRFEKDRMHGQGSFPLMVRQFAVVLLFELSEQHIGAGLRRRHRGDQNRDPIVEFVALGLFGIVAELQAVLGNSAAPLRSRQLRPLRGAKRYHLAVEYLAADSLPKSLLIRRATF